MAYEKVPINSVCPKAADRSHEWITRDGTSFRNGKPIRMTWCNKCGAVPK